MKKVACVGGGAGALMCACVVAPDVNLTIFEKNEKVGKKILATGNGRCNLTNLNMHDCSYNHDINLYLTRFNVKHTLDFFRSIGLETYNDEEGRVYPLSNSANSVLDVLRNNIENKNNVIIKTDSKVVGVNKTLSGFAIKLEDGTSEVFDEVILSCGNLLEGNIVSNLNLNLLPFKPSLCALKTDKHKNLAGVRVSNVKVSSKIGKQVFEEIGEVLFREDGISGIVTFNLSSIMARNNNYKAEINIDLLPNIEFGNILHILKNRQKNLSNYKNEHFLTGFFHKNINFEILKRANIKLDSKVGNLREDNLLEIVKNIKNLTFISIGPHDNNQVMSGGVLLTELNEHLQSKNINGLYVIGEAVDVDGLCGGYNLQWAWTSGYIVGKKL